MSRAAIALILATLLVACSAPAGSARAERKAFRLPDSVPATPQGPLEAGLPGVPNFGVITRDVWRGGQPSTEGLEVLVAMGVKTIIDLREEGDESASIAPSVHYIRLPTSAWHADLVDVQKILHAISENPKPIFVHCQQGRDRTGLAIAAYRLSTGMKAQDACTELVNFHVNPWWQGPIERRIRSLAASRQIHVRTNLQRVPGKAGEP